MRVNKELVAPLVVITLVTLTGLPGTTDTGKMTAFPLAGPSCQWSDAGGTLLVNGSTLTGPGALLTVNWTGGDQPVINNTLEFQAGFVFNQSGCFNETSTVGDSHVYSVFLPAGYHYFELWWNDTTTDLDGCVYTGDWQTLITEGRLSTVAFPETTNATVPFDGNYFIWINWYDGPPAHYWFYIRGVEPPHVFHESSASGPNQTFNTVVIPDTIYQVTATCYDSAENRYSETRTFTVDNLLPPLIDWVKINGKSLESVNGTEFERGTGTGITFEWQPSDPNAGDDIYANLFYKEPGDTVYSPVFYFLNVTDYTVNWDAGIIQKDGHYQFKLEVYNYDQEPVPAGTVEFRFTIVQAPTTTETGSNGTSSSRLDGAPTFTLTSLLAALLLLPLVRRQRKKQ